MMNLEPMVYVVDDDPSFRQTVSLLLQSGGFGVKVFTAADELLNELDPMPAACLLIDLRMPGMDGLTLQKELSKRLWTPPIVMISAYGRVSSSVKAMKAGAINFLEKPISPDLLLTHIREAVDIGLHARKQHADQADLVRRIHTLTSRERQVLDLVVEGKTSKEIAAEFHRSELTINLHRTRILKKVQARNLAHLVRMVVGMTSSSHYLVQA